MKINIDTKGVDKVIKIDITYSDCFNLDGTLGRVIVAALEAFKLQEYAGFTVEEQDLPEHLRYEEPVMINGSYTERGLMGTDPLRQERFEWVINEMIFAFKSCYSGEGEDFWIDDPNYDPNADFLIDNEEGSLTINSQLDIDQEKQAAYNKRIQNGLNMFSKYYKALWI